MSGKSKSGQRKAAANPQHEEPLPREPSVRTPTQHWVYWLVPLLIALITFAAFLPALQNQLVWDDEQNLLGNPHYRGLGWIQLRWMWTTHMGHYIPLTWMTLGLDYLLWGMNPLGYHLTNLLLHAANAVVFFFVVRRILTRALPVLSGLFYLLTILVYLRACEPEKRGRGWYWLSVAVFGCALLSKSMVVNLPVMLLTLDVYPLRRLGRATGWWSAPARRVYAEKIPFVLLAAAASVIALMAQLSHRAMVSATQLSALDRLLVSTYGLSFYLWKMVVPVNLSPLYELPPTVNPRAMPFILSYGLALAITGISLALRRRVPGLAAASLAYIVVLLPVLGIFQSGPQIAADRYTYLASLGWAILASAGLLFHSRRRPFLFNGLAACVLFGLGILMWNQVQVWHDSEKLWTHALATYPQSSVAENNLGIVRAGESKLAEAIEHYQRALQIRPGYAEVHYNWGNALAQQGKLAEASEHHRQALRLKPDYADAHNNLGITLAQQGKLAEASDHFQESLRIIPDDAEVHYNWGNALALQGKLAEASEHYQRALQINPDFAQA